MEVISFLGFSRLLTGIVRLILLCTAQFPAEGQFMAIEEDHRTH